MPDETLPLLAVDAECLTSDGFAEWAEKAQEHFQITIVGARMAETLKLGFPVVLCPPVGALYLSPTALTFHGEWGTASMRPKNLSIFTPWPARSTLSPTARITERTLSALREVVEGSDYSLRISIGAAVSVLLNILKFAPQKFRSYILSELTREFAKLPPPPKNQDHSLH